MLVLTPQKKVSLKGAIHVGGNSFFVYSDKNGSVFINNSKDVKLYKNIVKSMIKANPYISTLLDDYKIKQCFDVSILEDLANGHMNDTCKIVNGVYEFLPDYLKLEINKNVIKEAAMLHDLGKILIPTKILRKPSKLNIKEREIMNIHSILGYELLKTQDISSATLELIKFHHQNLNNSGYPSIHNGENLSIIGVQIISIADKYSALREQRVYRKKLSKLEALLILYKEVKEGKILKEVYNALLEYVKKYDNK